jgi:signal transduction histidine kinase
LTAEAPKGSVRSDGFPTGGAILASTLDQNSGAGLAAAVTDSDATREPMSVAEGTAVLRHTECAGIPCYLAYRRVSPRTDAIVALMLDTSELSAATGTMTRTILLSAGLSLVVMVFVSQRVARRVTGPLEQFIAFTHDVSPGVSRRRAVVGNDEIGRLAGAFNEMLDRLDSAQDALVRSEKLAVTGLLAARVAHDIRNPPSSIRMQTQLLLRSRMSAEQAKPLLQAVLHDIDQVESVVRDLLELARPGDLKLASTRLNLIVNAKAVIDGHGGRISLAPRQPKRTCVTIWLPVRDVEPASEPGASDG